jgi:methylglutaconyl-CoA hydratase
LLRLKVYASARTADFGLAGIPMSETTAETPVILERRGPVAIVKLNRPEKHNAINAALSGGLAASIAECEADAAVRCIVITGAGDRAFCAGADMAERVAQMDGAPPQSGERREQAGDGIGAIGRATKPTIAAINGYAYGGGALLAINTDIRLASPSATIRFVGASYGLVVGGSQLPRIVGPAHAKELIFSARIIDADEAERIGLVNHVVHEGTVLDAAISLAEQIAGNSPAAVALSKRVIDAATEVEEGRRAEAEANRSLRASDDHATRFRDATARVTGRA